MWLLFWLQQPYHGYFCFSFMQTLVTRQLMNCLLKIFFAAVAFHFLNRKLAQIENNLKIEPSISLRRRDEEVKVHA